jgi:HPt (histidine-containing phosphotransfer) domain-containing protein
VAFHLHQDRRQDGLRLLDAIEAGLPDSQFSPDTPAALRQLMTGVRGLQQFELADYVRRAAQLSTAKTLRARSRFRLLIRLCRDLLLLGPDSIPELANMRTGYLEKRSVDLDRLEFALRGGDFGTLDKIGHNLKGTGAAYGFGELTELGRSLEAAARSENAGAVENLLDQMEAYISIARPFA